MYLEDRIYAAKNKPSTSAPVQCGANTAPASCVRRREEAALVHTYVDGSRVARTLPLTIIDDLYHSPSNASGVDFHPIVNAGEENDVCWGVRSLALGGHQSGCRMKLAEQNTVRISKVLAAGWSLPNLTRRNDHSLCQFKRP